MEIKIPENLVTQALEDAAQRAISYMLSGREVHNALVEAVSNSVATDFVKKAVTEAANALDHSAVTKAIAAEMQRTLTAAMSAVIEDAAVEIIARIRHTYTDSEKQQIRIELRQLKNQQ